MARVRNVEEDPGWYSLKSEEVISSMEVLQIAMDKKKKKPGRYAAIKDPILKINRKAGDTVEGLSRHNELLTCRKLDLCRRICQLERTMKLLGKTIAHRNANIIELKSYIIDLGGKVS